MLTEKEALKKSIRMWEWLYINFPKGKENYPAFISDNIIDYDSACPCCEFYECCECPLYVNKGCDLWALWDIGVKNEIIDEDFDLEGYSKEESLAEIGKSAALIIFLILKAKLKSIIRKEEFDKNWDNKMQEWEKFKERMNDNSE